MKLAIAGMILVASAWLVSACAGLFGGDAAEAGPVSEVRTIGMRYSRFTTTKLTVRAGTAVTFVLKNDDPIGHEWIIGSDDVHARHRTGTEPYHDQVATEMSIEAYTTKKTVVTFDKPGEYTFVCHLPGHEEYGMRGVVRVTS